MHHFLVGNSEKFDTQTIEYTRTLVERIENDKGVIYEFLQENEICFNRFLEETLTLAEIRLKKSGIAELTGVEFEEVLDLLALEVDLDKMITTGHIDSYTIDENDEEYRMYIPDQIAVDFFKDKYDVDLELNKPFDFDLFYQSPEDDNPIKDLTSDVCLN
jgi:hypothetical protein